jgi:DNA-binding transcriptional LysR family regulator
MALVILFPMDLRQIRQFTVLAEELNFRKAASRLHISQPPLSATIRKLEEQLDVRLFERNRHAVSLTTAGEVFLAQARKILAQVDDAVALTKNAARGGVGLLRVSCVPSALFALMPVALRRFHDAYPLVQVVATEALSARQLELVRQGKVDVAVLIPGAAEDHPHLRIVPLRDEHFVLACPSDHKLASRKTVRVQDIDSNLLLHLHTPSQSPGFSGALMKTFEESDTRPTVIYSHDEWGISLLMVAGGFGFAIVPRPMHVFGLPGVSYVELVHRNGTPVTYPIAAALPANARDPIAENFLALLGDVAGANPPAARGSRRR